MKRFLVSLTEDVSDQVLVDLEAYDVKVVWKNCKNAERYWVCGFEEDKLKTPSVKDLCNYRELVKEFVNWTYINNIKLSTRQFKQMLEGYKKGENVFN